jgi:hypothetical protein
MSKRYSNKDMLFPGYLEDTLLLHCPNFVKLDTGEMKVVCDITSTYSEEEGEQK